MPEDAANMDASATWDAAVQGWNDEGWNVEELSGNCFKLIYQNFGDISVMVAFWDGLYHIQTEYKGRGVRKAGEYGEDDSRPWSEALDEPYAKLPEGKLADELKANKDFQQYVIGLVNELKGLLATFHRSNAWKDAVGQHKKWKIWIWQLYALVCDLDLPEEGKPFMDIFEDKENGDFVIKLSNRTHDAGLLKKTLTRIGLADMEIRDNCSVRLNLAPPSEANAVPERVKHWIERLSSGLDGTSFSLIIDYPGICEVVYEEGRIKVKSNADWKHETLELDDIAGELARLAEGHSLALNTSGGCLLSCNCGVEAAKAIFAELRNFAPKEREAKEESSKDEDDRIFPDLPEVEAWTLADILKWKLNLPAYQRPYVWEAQKNVEPFWKNISEFKDERGHYDFGMIVLHKKAGSYDIVDGQQRLVTLALMLTALGSDAAASFIGHARLQGKASEANTGANLRYLMRKAARLPEQKERDAMARTILEAKADVVVMADVDETLKFFNRMNTAGKELSKLDILKSHHLLALADDKSLSPAARARWQGRGFVPDACLDSPTEFRREVVKKWEGLRLDWFTWEISRAWALRIMARRDYPDSLDDINDKKKKIDEFRGGKYPGGIAKYNGLKSPIQDGEFFFWYAFNLYGEYKKLIDDRGKLENERIINDSEYYISRYYDAHMERLRDLLPRKTFQDFFELLVVYLHEKFPDDVNTEKFGMVVDRLFSWLVWIDLRYIRFQFSNLKQFILKKDSPAMALLSGETLEDCLDCDLENPLEFFAVRGWPNVSGNEHYLIRRELRRIWQDLYL